MAARLMCQYRLFVSGFKDTVCHPENRWIRHGKMRIRVFSLVLLHRSQEIYHSIKLPVKVEEHFLGPFRSDRPGG
jgi:hypothetical protein